MKIKKEFITNSSSTSFIFYFPKNKKLIDLLVKNKKFFNFEEDNKKYNVYDVIHYFQYKLVTSKDIIFNYSEHQLNEKLNYLYKQLEYEISSYLYVFNYLDLQDYHYYIQNIERYYRDIKVIKKLIKNYNKYNIINIILYGDSYNIIDSLLCENLKNIKSKKLKLIRLDN